MPDECRYSVLANGSYQHTTKRPQLAVFVATAPHIGSLAKCWRDVFDWEIKIPIRGYYEVQQIKTKTIFKDPLNPLKLLMYKGEADFPKPPDEFEEWYKQWRDVYNEEEFMRGWKEYFSEKKTKDPNITCSNCGYEWHTNSKMNNPTCPSCGHKTRNQLQPLLVL